MAGLSKQEYLKRYLSGSGEEEKKKKRRKKTKSKTVAPNIRIVDDDIDIKTAANQKEEGEITDDEDEAPTVADFIDERPEHVIQKEQYDSNRWKGLGQQKGPENNTDVDGSGGKSTRKSRHDSDSDDQSPAHGRQRHDSDSDHSPVRQRHDSEDDQSPVRKQRQDSESDQSPAMKGRHDSDSDQSPVRKQSQDSDSDQSPVRKKRNDSDSDQSPPRKQNSDSDQSPVRKQRHDSDSDKSPSRKHKNKKVSNKISTKKKRNDSDSDQSPPRSKNSVEKVKTKGDHSKRTSKKHKRQNSDSDQSPPRPSKNAKGGNDSDLSPPRPSRKGNESDLSPDRSKSRSASRGKTSPGSTNRSKDKHKKKDKEKTRKSRWGSVEKDQPEVDNDGKAKKTLGGAKAGLSSAQEMKEEADKLRKKEKEMFDQMDSELLGKDAKTQFRKTGRAGKKRREEEEETEESKERKAAMAKQYEAWGKGLKQQEEQDRAVAEAVYEASKPLTRHQDDDDLDSMLKDQDREGDPMLAYMKRKKKKKQSTEGAAAPVKELPKYKGPEPPPNRFGIRPGYRWDGVDRTNGFEKKIFETQASRKAMKEAAYKWSIEDM